MVQGTFIIHIVLNILPFVSRNFFHFEEFERTPSSKLDFANKKDVKF